MKKLLLSVMTIALVAVVGVFVTKAYFSDTETSTGNTFTAGQINLTIDDTAYYNKVLQDGNGGTPDLVWGLTDLTNQLFFNFSDLKPGDTGENTISYHVENNDAWGCFNVALTGSEENSINEPESDDGDVSAAAWQGELDNNLQYIVWGDDGDNVLEDDEVVFNSGSFNGFPQSPGTGGTTFTLADSITNNTYLGIDGNPIIGTSTEYLGFGWCFGTLTPMPLGQGAGGDPTVNPGFTCDGSLVDNTSQSDSVIGDITFYAVQQRNNTGFLCSSWTP